MVNQALFDVVKNQLASGVSDSEVKEFLRRRGSSEPEIQELFEALASQSVTIRDIPVIEPVEVPVSPIAPVESMPTQSEAHGVVRDIPPLQPSAPFAPIDPQQFVAPAMTSTVSVVEQLPAASKKKTYIVAGAGIVAVIVLMFGGYFVYSSYFASPEKVMDTMISRLRDVRSGEFSITMTAVTNSLDSLAATSTGANPFLAPFAVQGPVTINFNASGTVNLLDEKNPKLGIVFTASMDKWSMGDFKLGAEYRNIDQTNYLKITDVPDLGFISLSFLKNQWFKAGDREAKTQLGGITSSTSSDDVIPTVSQEQRDKLFAAWKAHRFFVVTDVLDSEKIDGVSTHHYKLAFDNDAFIAWNKELAVIFNWPEDETGAITKEELDRLTTNELEIWIGKTDGLPHKIRSKGVVRDKNDASKTSESTIVVTGNKFNTVLNVTVPEDAKSIQDALQGIFGQMLGEGNISQKESTAQSRNAQRESNIQSIMSAVRLHIADNNGAFSCPSVGPLPTKATFMGSSGYDIARCISPKYISSVPKDPSKGTSLTTGYSIFYTAATKKITIRAPYAELGKKISITR